MSLTIDRTDRIDPRETTQLEFARTPPAVVDAARALSNMFTVLFFGGAISIVVMTFTRGGN